MCERVQSVFYKSYRRAVVGHEGASPPTVVEMPLMAARPEGGCPNVALLVGLLVGHRLVDSKDSEERNDDEKN